VAYLGQFFYPSGLAVFYPHPENIHPGSHFPIWEVAGAALLLMAVSAGVVACRRRFLAC